MARQPSNRARNPRPRTPTEPSNADRGGSTEAGAMEHFATVKPGLEVEYLIFDGVLDGEEIYELWYREDGEWCVSFVTHTERQGYGYVDSIAKLLLNTSRRRGALERELQILKEGRLRLYVASAAFLVSLATLVLIAFKTQSGGTAVILTIIGVVSSGALFFFGAWVPGGIFVRKVSKV